MKNDDVNWKYLLRQLLVNSGIWTCYFIIGLISGAPTVLMPQLRNEMNSSDEVTVEKSSWLLFTISYSGIPWVILVPPITSFVGRKICFTVVSFVTFISFVIFYCSSNVNHIIISEVFLGILAASNTTIAVVICTEYTSPKYRGIFLTIKSASFYWGVLVANIIGTFLHWKNIPLLGLICSVYCLATVYIWPESPLWLGKNGNFDKCKHAHRWLKGKGSDAEKELEKLISREQQTDKKQTLKLRAIDSLKAIFKKNICKTFLLCFLLQLSHIFSGKLLCTMYAVEILRKMFVNKSTIYSSMLIIDVVTVLSVYIGCGLAKFFRRRTLLLSFSTITALFLYLLSVYLYLVKLSIIFENTYLALCLFLGYSIAISCGPLILSSTIAGELLPLESRNISLCVTALTYKFTNGSLIKIFPYIFNSFNTHGTFLFLGISLTICIILIYIYVPETKDKTLHEIADTIGGINSIAEVQELLPNSSDKV